MAFKPFPMQEPNSKQRWGTAVGIAPVKHKNFPLSDFYTPGASIRARKNGARNISVNRNLSEPEKVDRKKEVLTLKQLNAAHVKFLDEKGWNTKKICEHLKLGYAFVYGVVSYINFKFIKSQMPPDFEESGAQIVRAV